MGVFVFKILGWDGKLWPFRDRERENNCVSYIHCLLKPNSKLKTPPPHNLANLKSQVYY